MSSDQDTPAPRLARLLIEHRERLIQQWTRLVLDDPQVPEANRLSEPVLRDHIPRLLDRLVSTLPPATEPRLSDPDDGARYACVKPARDHARDRIIHSYSLTEALRELSHVRVAIVDLCFQEQIPLQHDEVHIFHAMLDEAMAATAIEMEASARAAQELGRRRLRSILQLLPVGVLITDVAGGVIEANSAAEAIWGGPMPEVQDRSANGPFQAFWPRTGKRVEPEDWPTSRALDRGEETLNEEIDIRSFDGQRKTVLSSAAPIRDRDGVIVGSVAVHVDVTDRVKAARKLREVAELREIFIGILGHDLRNPIATIAFTTELMLRSPDRSEKDTKDIRRIAASAERMMRMVNDLLDLTRGRLGGGIPIEPKRMDLHALCRQVVEDLAVIHPERTVLIDTEGDGVGLWDPDRLTQLMSNLVGNALSYSPEETPVRVSIREQGADVILEVANCGDGIPPEQLTMIFEPFRRGAIEGGASSGLGLGLFIAQGIAQAHGGSIQVRSEPDAETTFTVSLPRAPAPPAGAPRA